MRQEEQEQKRYSKKMHKAEERPVIEISGTLKCTFNKSRIVISDSFVKLSRSMWTSGGVG